MDINQLRVVATVVCFVSFIGIVWWAWSRKRAAAFEEAARLPFADESSQEGAQHG